MIEQTDCDHLPPKPYYCVQCLLNEIATLEDSVENFLAVLFRDGGHKTAEFDSLVEALSHAQSVAVDLFAEIDRLESRVKGMEGLADRDRDEIAKLRVANENNLEGWAQNVAGLQRQLRDLRDE